MKKMIAILYLMSGSAFADDVYQIQSTMCGPTNAPPTKVVELDGELLKVCLVCEYDFETGKWEWAYRNYNCPGVIHPDNG